MLLCQKPKSLNPCFNGRYSQRERNYKRTITVEGLNPCFNGRYSQSTATLELLKKGKES